MATGPLRIVLTGSEATGKSTLAAQLGAFYGVPWSAEYSRAYAMAKGERLGAVDVEPIARGQIAGENEAIERMPNEAGFVVHDADLLSTIIYARHYYGACPTWIEEEWCMRRADLYLLLDIDLPWVADGIRDRGTEREAMQRLFRDELERRQLRYEQIRGGGPERLLAAQQCIEELRRGFGISE
jgi:nicotinamide riboside kinase